MGNSLTSNICILHRDREDMVELAESVLDCCPLSAVFDRREDRGQIFYNNVSLLLSLK
jgi:hypothetical protein